MDGCSFWLRRAAKEKGSSGNLFRDEGIVV
jgi:hypothetical protein